MTLARNILFEAQKPSDCPFISSENMKKIEDAIPEKEVDRKHPHPNAEEDMIEIHPCTEDGKVTLETQLKSKTMKRDLFSDFFDQFQMCDLLSEVNIFDKMNCSSKMGYGLVEMKGKRVHIFKTGKIIMRRADDRQDALGTFSKLSKVLMPARICSCGNIMADCFGGSCKICSSDICATLIDFLDLKKEGIGFLTMGELLKDSELLNNEKLTGNFEAIRDIVDEIRKIYEDVTSQKKPAKDDQIKKIDEILAVINRTSMECILEEPEAKIVFLALMQYGLARDLKRVRDGFLNLEIKKEDESFKNAADLFFQAYHAFDNIDITESQAIQERYNKLLSARDITPPNAAIAKIATNGFYISRILGKPVPDIKLLDMDMKMKAQNGG